MGKDSGPPPQDYRGAAQAQGQANIQAARTTARLSNPNVINPYGTQRVTYDGDIPTVEQTLAPQQQSLLDARTRIANQLAGVGNRQAGQLSDTFSQPLTSYSVDPGVGGLTQISDAIMERNSPYFNRLREQTENDLLTRGFNPGTQGYDARMDDINRSENDMRIAALLAGGTEQSRIANLESQRRMQDMQERAQPLNELASLMSLSSPTVPGYQGYQGVGVNPAPILDAAMAQDAANQRAYQNQVAAGGGLFNLGGALLGGAGAAGGFGKLFSL